MRPSVTPNTLTLFASSFQLLKLRVRPDEHNRVTQFYGSVIRRSYQQVSVFLRYGENADSLVGTYLPNDSVHDG